MFPFGAFWFRCHRARRCDLLLLLRCCAAAAGLCAQNWTHILAQYRDLITILLERSAEGKEANRDLTDTVRERARETCTLATIAAGQLRSRELSKNFGRSEYLRRLHDAVSSHNIPQLARILSNLNEALSSLLAGRGPRCLGNIGPYRTRISKGMCPIWDKQRRLYATST